MPIQVQKRFMKTYKPGFFGKLFAKKPTPTDRKIRSHIVQIGDPVLRENCIEVPKETLNEPLVQDTIKALKNIIDTHDALGVSAPQIGVPLRIACVQMTKKQFNSWDTKTSKERGMEIIDKQIIINPICKPLSDETASFREACTSIQGYSAVVPRFTNVSVKFMSENGETTLWKARNWTARLLQHEIDHLNGVLYTDKMIPETFICNYWKTINAREGNFYLDFGSHLRTLGKFNTFFVPKKIITDRDL